MLRKEFEKRHGKIWWPSADVAIRNIKISKYNLRSDDQPAAVWWIVQNFPDETFTDLDFEAFGTIFKYLAELKDKSVRDYYLTALEQRFFDKPYGWFLRGGNSPYTSNKQMDEKTKPAAIKILNILKHQFKKFGYRCRYTSVLEINRIIKELSIEHKTKQNSFAKAINKTNEMSNLKTKKEYRKKSLLDRFIHSR